MDKDLCQFRGLGQTLVPEHILYLIEPGLAPWTQVAQLDVIYIAIHRLITDLKHMVAQTSCTRSKD